MTLAIIDSLLQYKHTLSLLLILTQYADQKAGGFWLLANSWLQPSKKKVYLNPSDNMIHNTDLAGIYISQHDPPRTAYFAVFGSTGGFLETRLIADHMLEVVEEKEEDMLAAVRDEASRP